MVQLTFTQMQKEMERRTSKRNDLLREFQDKGSLLTGEILTIAGTGVSSRIKELKRKGHKIISQYEGPGVWRYTYLGDSETVKEYGDTY